MGKNIKEIKLQAEDIICAGCAEDLGNILRDKDGILDAYVNYADAIITIRYDDKLIKREQILLTVKKLGFKSKIISESL